MSKLTAYKNNYIAENYDRIHLTVPKGMKAQIEEKAKAEGKSTNGFIAAGETVASTPKKATPAPKKPAAPKKQEPPKASKKDMDIFLF